MKKTLINALLALLACAMLVGFAWLIPNGHLTDEAYARHHAQPDDPFFEEVDEGEDDFDLSYLYNF